MPELLRGALEGHSADLKGIIDTLTPVIQARVARVLLRAIPACRSTTGLRELLRDMVQDIFLHLFEHDGRILRQWDPEKGLSFENYIGLISERETISLLRSKRRHPWTNDPSTPAVEEYGAEHGFDDETSIISRDLLRVLYQKMKDRLTTDGLRMFYALFVDEKSVEIICNEFKMTPDAVYTWKTRLRKIARDMLAELTSETVLKAS